MLSRRDCTAILILGAAVGLLVQPVITNTVLTTGKLPFSLSALHMLAFFGFLVIAPLALLIASLLGRSVPVLYQFAKFAAVGVLNTFVDIGVFNLETFIFQVSQKISTPVFIVLKIVSFFGATTNSYLWNKFWTFGSSERSGSEAAKFYSVAIVGGLINVTIATLVKTGTPPGFLSAALWINVISPAAGVLTAFLWDFLGYKFFVFKSVS